MQNCGSSEHCNIARVYGSPEHCWCILRHGGCKTAMLAVKRVSDLLDALLPLDGDAGLAPLLGLLQLLQEGEAAAHRAGRLSKSNKNKEKRGKKSTPRPLVPSWKSSLSTSSLSTSSLSTSSLPTPSLSTSSVHHYQHHQFITINIINVITSSLSTSTLLLSIIPTHLFEMLWLPLDRRPVPGLRRRRGGHRGTGHSPGRPRGRRRRGRDSGRRADRTGGWGGVEKTTTCFFKVQQRC